MGMRVLGAVLLCSLFACTPAVSKDDIFIYSLPDMDGYTCYMADANPNVMACTDGDVLPQDPDLLNTIWETTLSYFPTIEIDDDLRFLVIYQRVGVYEKRLYKRIPMMRKAEKEGINFYVHAHTYYDPAEKVIAIEVPTPPSVQTLVHEILHHVVNQLAEDGILDHEIVDRMANLILESKRMKDALRENH